MLGNFEEEKVMCQEENHLSIFVELRLEECMRLSEMEMKEVGRITHYFPRINVAVVKLSDKLSVGDKILVKGSTTNLEQTAESMQIEHKNVVTAERGQSIGLKVAGKVREGDVVYKVLS